jgi:hypothetical protein
MLTRYILFSQVVTIYRIYEDLVASTETTAIGLVVFTLQTYTCPSTLLGPTLRDQIMISGQEFGAAHPVVYTCLDCLILRPISMTTW